MKSADRPEISSSEEVTPLLLSRRPRWPRPEPELVNADVVEGIAEPACVCPSRSEARKVGPMGVSY